MSIDYGLERGLGSRFFCVIFIIFVYLFWPRRGGKSKKDDITVTTYAAPQSDYTPSDCCTSPRRAPPKGSSGAGAAGRG